jgi:hypothetical protein
MTSIPGLITSYNSPLNSTFYELYNGATLQPSGIFISPENIGKCFLDTRDNQVYLNQYLDSAGPWSTYNSDNQKQTQASALVAAQNLITINNVTNIQNIVQNIINPPITEGPPADGSIAAQFVDIKSSILALNTWNSTLSGQEQSDMTNIQTNSTAIVTLQNTVNNILVVLQNLNVLAIQNKSYKMNLI